MRRDGRAFAAAGRYFRTHMLAYFEGLDGERGIVWRCSDSRSLQDFLRLGKGAALNTRLCAGL